MRLLSLGSVLFLFACVGDETIIPPPTDGGSDATVQMDSAPPQDVAVDMFVDSPLVCDGGVTVLNCSGTCVDIAGSKGNCGACGHDCGGGDCTAGVCQPVNLTTQAYPAFDVDSTNIYFQKGTTDPFVLATCVSSGCILAPTTLSSPGDVYAYNEGGNALVFGSNIAFFGEAAIQPGKGRLFACDQKNGCSTSPVTLANAGLQSFGSDLAVSGNDAYWTVYKNLQHANCTSGNTCGAAENLISALTVWPRIGLSADSAGVYFIDPTTRALERCPTSGACSPTTLATFNATTLSTATYMNTIYVLDSNSSGYVKGSINTCPNSGTCTKTLFVGNLPYPTILAVDADGIYWYESDPQDIQTCPLTGCKPSPRTLVTGVLINALRTDAKFVYYSTATGIYRVAK